MKQALVLCPGSNL